MVTVGEAGTGSQAVTLARQEKPDVILMDIRMPMLDGIEAGPPDHRVTPRRPSPRC